MIFSNFKTSSVRYIINELDCPLGIIPNIEKYSNIINQTKCPAVAMVNNRLYYANSFLDIDIDFGIKDNEPYFNYTFTKEHPTTQSMHNLIKKIVSVQLLKSNANVHLQVNSPYSFVTDTKDIEVISLPTDIETKNCVYVPGGLKPYYWIRNFNSAFLLNDTTKEAKVKLRVNKPMFLFYFNKPVDLKFTEVTEKIRSYTAQATDVVNYRNKIEKYFMNVVSRRPRKLLQ